MSKKPEKALHKQKAAPSKLARLIELVNLLPHDYPLPHPVTIRADANLGDAGPIHSVLRLSAYLEKFAQTLPPQFRDYLLTEPTPDNFYESLHEGGSLGRYETFWDARECLRFLAQKAQAGHPIEYVLISVKGSLIPTTYRITVDPHGKTQTQTSISISLVDEALKDADATRICECQICNRIFWAGRKDQKCCSKRCANVRRVQLWRKNYAEKYKLQRNGYKPLGSNKGKRS